jgi:GNAT superfamily N-acetyltransferase
MPRIPRSEREVKTSGQPLPYSTGEGYEAVGKAMSGLGRGLASLGDGIDSFALKAERERDDLDMFTTQKEYTKFLGEQTIKQQEHDAGISGDGTDHLQRRMEQYDNDAVSFVDRLPNNRKARQYAALHLESARSRFGSQTYARQQEHLGSYYEAETDKLVVEQIVPRMKGDAASAEQALGAVENIIGGARGMPEGVKDSIRRKAAQVVFKAWLEKAGPEAGVQAEEIVKRFKVLGTPDSSPNVDGAPAPQQKQIMNGRDLSALVPVQKGLLNGSKDRSIDALQKPFVSSLARMLNDMPEELRATLEINEAHRSHQYQAQLRARYESGQGGLAAPAGKSRHNHGEAVDFSPVGGYQKGQDRALYNKALQWMYANSERYGIVNPESIRGRDPHHFQLMPGAGDGGPVSVRVADASGGVPSQGPRSAADYFVQAVTLGEPQIRRAALAAERRIETEENKAVRLQREETAKLGVDLMARRELTRDWIEQNRDNLNARDYDRFTRMVTPRARSTDAATYTDLLERADEKPDEVISSASDAYANGLLNQEAFERIYGKAQKSKRQETRAPSWAAEQRQIVKKALKPDKDASEDQIKAYQSALEKFDEYVDQGQADKSLERQALTKYAQEAIKDFKLSRVTEGRKALSMPRYSSVGRDVMTAEEIRAATQRTIQALNAKKITKEEAAAEANLLKKWSDVLENEMSATGTRPKPSPVKPSQQDPSSPFADPSKKEPLPGMMKLGGPKEEEGKQEEKPKQATFKRIVKDAEGNIIGMVEEPYTGQDKDGGESGSGGPFVEPTPEQRGFIAPLVIPRGSSTPELGLPQIIKGPLDAARTLMSEQGQYRPGTEDAEGVALANQAAGAAMMGGVGANAIRGAEAMAVGSAGGKLHPARRVFDFETKGGGMREAKIGDTTIEYGVSRDGASAELILIKTDKDKRGHGSARAALEQFVKEADESGKTLFLNADPMDKGVSKSGLENFYKSLGFVKNTGRNKDFTSRAEFVRPARQTEKPE